MRKVVTNISKEGNEYPVMYESEYGCLYNPSQMYFQWLHSEFDYNEPEITSISYYGKEPLCFDDIEGDAVDVIAEYLEISSGQVCRDVRYHLRSYYRE